MNESLIDAPDTWLRNDPHDTEVSGAEVGLGRSGTHRRIAYDLIVSQDGCTSDEVSRYLDHSLGMYVPPNQVASRIGELVRDGFVYDSGERRVTRRGGEAIVWKKIVPPGKA